MDLVYLQRLNLTVPFIICQDYQEGSDAVRRAAYQSSRCESHPHGGAFLQQNQRGEFDHNYLLNNIEMKRLNLKCSITPNVHWCPHVSQFHI